MQFVRKRWARVKEFQPRNVPKPWGAWVQSWSLFWEAKMACFKPHKEPLDGVEHLHFYPQYEGPTMQPGSSKDGHMHGKAQLHSAWSTTTFVLLRKQRFRTSCVWDPVTWKPGNHRLQSTTQPHCISCIQQLNFFFKVGADSTWTRSAQDPPRPQVSLHSTWWSLHAATEAKLSYSKTSSLDRDSSGDSICMSLSLPLSLSPRNFDSRDVLIWDCRCDETRNDLQEWSWRNAMLRLTFWGLFFPAPELETWKFGNMLGSGNLGREINWRAEVVTLVNVQLTGPAICEVL